MSPPPFCETRQHQYCAKSMGSGVRLTPGSLPLQLSIPSQVPQLPQAVISPSVKWEQSQRPHRVLVRIQWNNMQEGPGPSL